MGSSSGDLVEWLQANKALTVTDVRPVGLGTATAVQLELTRSAACVGPQLALFQFESDRAGLITLGTGERMRVLVGDVGVAAVTVVVAAPKDAFIGVARDARAVLDSVVWVGF